MGRTGLAIWTVASPRLDWNSLIAPPCPQRISALGTGNGCTLAYQGDRLKIPNLLPTGIRPEYDTNVGYVFRGFDRLLGCSVPLSPTLILYAMLVQLSSA